MTEDDPCPGWHAILRAIPGHGDGICLRPADIAARAKRMHPTRITTAIDAMRQMGLVLVWGWAKSDPYIYRSERGDLVAASDMPFLDAVEAAERVLDPWALPPMPKQSKATQRAGKRAA